MWPGREMAFLKGNLPTVSRVVALPCPATSLPLWQCQNSTVAESRLGSHNGGPAILTPFSGASRFPRQSLNGGARAVDTQIQALTPPVNLVPRISHEPAALRRCLTMVETKKEGPELWKAATPGGMPPVRDLLTPDRKPSPDPEVPWLWTSPT